VAGAGVAATDRAWRFDPAAGAAMERAMHQLAIYDMDKTITRKPTWQSFLNHAVARRAPWRFVLYPLLLAPLAGFALGRTDRGRLKEMSQRLLLGPHLRPQEIEPLVEGFADRMLASNILPGARTRIAADKAAGRRLVLATASYRLYAEPIARRLGFDDVIATGSFAGLDARVHAKIDGENCYGPAKLRMVEAWLAAQQLARADCHILFYSDHASDEPVLEWADEAFAVNAHDRLKQLAAARGWPQLDWS